MANLRCRPGDLARIIHSRRPELMNRIVFVEYLYDSERWAITLLGEPAFGLTERGRRPVVTNEFSIRDWRLEPLRGEEQANEQHQESAFQHMHSAEHSLQDMGGA